MLLKRTFQKCNPMLTSCIFYKSTQMSLIFRPYPASLMFSTKNKLKWLNMISQKKPQSVNSTQKAIVSEKWTLLPSDTEAYTSSHFRVRPGEIEDFLRTHSLVHKNTTNEVVLQICPLCPKPHKNDPTNMWTLNIESTIGVFQCFR
jgi:hypothetical protein